MKHQRIRARQNGAQTRSSVLEATGPRDVYRLGVGLLATLPAAFCCRPMSAATSDVIPPLRPPQAEIPPGFWELYGTWVIWGGLFLLALMALAVWRLTRPKPAPVVCPATRARNALRELAAGPETGPVLSQVSQTVRRYFTEALGVAPSEMTTTQFCQSIAGNSRLSPELSEETTKFLRLCDERKFAPAPPAEPLKAVSRALVLVDKADQALATPEASPAPPAPTPAAPSPAPASGTAGSGT